MPGLVSTSAFSAVEHYFGDSRTESDFRVNLFQNGGKPVELTPTQAKTALYGPSADPDLGAAIWHEALRRACDESGPSGEERLFLAWLMLPRLYGSVHRICRRLRAEREDVEAELLLGLLEQLQPGLPKDSLTLESLLKATRSCGWRFARTGVKERASGGMEDVSNADPRSLRSQVPDDSSSAEELCFVVTRYGGPDHLRAQLRFRVAPGLLSPRVRKALDGAAAQQGVEQQGVPS